MPKPIKLPPHIKEIVEQNKKKGDTFEYLPAGVSYGGFIYYYIFYHNSRTYLLIREDGVVPLFNEVEQIIKLCANIVGLTHQMDIHGGRYTRRLTRLMYTRVLRRLSSIDQVCRPSMPQELSNALDTFKSVCKEIIDYQKQIKEAYLSSRNITHQFVKKGVVTLEDRDRLRSCHLQLVRSLYYQNMLQLNSYQEREKLIRYLASRITLSRPRLWLEFQELRWHHNHMMNRLEPGDKEIIEEGERVIFHGEEFEDDKKVLDEIYASTLNPKT